MDQPSDLWRTAPPPSSRLRACVVLPVRNEADGLLRCLSALALQRGAREQPFDGDAYEILLLANNCDDASADIARAFSARHPGLALHIAEVRLPPALANIGHVRKVLMDMAAVRLAGAGPQGVIASTDGDTVVAPDWLARTLEAVDAGADAVGGRIFIEASDDNDAALRRRRRLDDAYRLACEQLASRVEPERWDPWPRHHQHFCGSLAVTRGAYLRVGGVPDVSYLEDEALVAALRRQDLRVRHSPKVRVTTSGRQVGRAEVGLAWQLSQWAEGAAEAGDQMVEGAAVLEARLVARRQLRTWWQCREASTSGDLAGMTHLAARWQLSVQALDQRVAAASAFGELWAALEAGLPEGPPTMLVPVRTAINQLRAHNGRHSPVSLAQGAATGARTDPAGRSPAETHARGTRVVQALPAP